MTVHKGGIVIDPQHLQPGDEKPEAWRSSPLLVEAAAITGAPYKCPVCGVFALDEQGCCYCGWAGEETSHG
jgi:hypothetical protein